MQQGRDPSISAMRAAKASFGDAWHGLSPAEKRMALHSGGMSRRDSDSESDDDLTAAATSTRAQARGGHTPNGTRPASPAAQKAPEARVLRFTKEAPPSGSSAKMGGVAEEATPLHGTTSTTKGVRAAELAHDLGGRGSGTPKPQPSARRGATGGQAPAKTGGGGGDNSKRPGRRGRGLSGRLTEARNTPVELLQPPLQELPSSDDDQPSSDEEMRMLHQESLSSGKRSPPTAKEQNSADRAKAASNVGILTDLIMSSATAASDSRTLIIRLYVEVADTREQVRDELANEIRRVCSKFGVPELVTVGTSIEVDEAPLSALVTFRTEYEYTSALQGITYDGWGACSLREQLSKGLSNQMQFLLECHHQDLPRHSSKSPVQNSQGHSVLMLLVIEQGRNLPWMELGGGDPYCICWHEEQKPDLRQLDQLTNERSFAARNCRQCRSICGAYCCCCEDEAPYLQHSDYIIETKPVFKNIANPRWGHRATHQFQSNPATMSKTGAGGRGYLIIEVYDHDYIGQDDPMGRVEIDLDKIPLDTISDEWYDLGWIPGQTRPGPQGDIQVRLLMSHELKQTNWLIKSKSHDFVAIQEEIDICTKAAEKSRLIWYLHEVIHEAFKIFDVDGGGDIEPPELAHMMFLLGEQLTPTELAYMIAECKVWGQPKDKPVVLRRSGRTHSMGVRELGKLVDSGTAVSTFKPKSIPAVLDLGTVKLNEAEFRVMLTEYWTRRKYGDRTLGAVHDKFKSLKKKKMDSQAGRSHELGGGSLVSAAAVETDVEFVQGMQIDHAPITGTFAENVMPTPGWMTDIAGDHKRLRSENRTPQMFWYYLVRKMEQLLNLKESSGIEDAGIFRRNSESTKHFVGGWSVRNNNSQFSAYWDLMQVVLLIYVCISVPYQTGFDITVETGEFVWCIEVFVDAYFLIDIFINFRTPFVDEQGKMVHNGKAMAMRYLKGWFFIDVSSCASLLQYVFEMFDFGDSDAASKTRVAKVLRLLRLAKLLRVARLKRLVERMGDDLVTILAPVANILFLIIGTAFAMHLISCFWYLAGSNTDSFEIGGERRTGWVESTFGDSENVTMTTRYLTSLYGIMLGEFQLKPTDAEKGFALISVVVNGFIYGSVAATLSSIMMMLRAPHAEYNAKMDALKTWMRSKKLDYGVRTQVEAFYDAKLCSKGNVVVSETAIIADLQPAPIATELVQILYSETIERVPIFSKLEEEVIVKLCLALVPIPALKDSPVVIQGRVGSEMYIIIKGKLQVWESSKTSVTRVKCAHGGLYFWATAYDSENFTDGTIDLHGKGDLPELRPRALITTMESTLQGIVRHSMPTSTPTEPAVLTAPVEAESRQHGQADNARRPSQARRASITEIMMDKAGAAMERASVSLGLTQETQVRESVFFVDFDPALGTFATHKGELKDLKEGSRVDVLEVRKGTVLGYLTSGEYFGEASLIAEGQDDPNLRYDRNVTSVQDSELCYLQKENVLELSREYPQLKEELNRFAVMRQNNDIPRRKFNVFDDDASGTLDREEMRKLLEGLGTVHAEDVENEIDEMDWEQEGEITFEEFKAWWVRHNRHNELKNKKRWKAATKVLGSKHFNLGQLAKILPLESTVDDVGSPRAVTVTETPAAGNAELQDLKGMIGKLAESQKQLMAQMAQLTTSVQEIKTGLTTTD